MKNNHLRLKEKIKIGNGYKLFVFSIMINHSKFKEYLENPQPYFNQICFIIGKYYGKNLLDQWNETLSLNRGEIPSFSLLDKMAKKEKYLEIAVLADEQLIVSGFFNQTPKSNGQTSKTTNNVIEVDFKNRSRIHKHIRW